MKGKEKGTKKVLYRRFRYRNCDDLAELLQDMAMKGWHFTQWKLGLEFEKGLPQKVCYRVEVFPDASNYDYLPEREALEYSEYCRAAGWALVDAKRGPTRQRSSRRRNGFLISKRRNIGFTV